MPNVEKDKGTLYGELTVLVLPADSADTRAKQEGLWDLQIDRSPASD